MFRNGRHEVAFGFDEPGKVKDSYFVNEKEESHEQSGADEPVHQPLDGVGRRRTFGGRLSHSAKDGVEPAPKDLHRTANRKKASFKPLLDN